MENVKQKKYVSPKAEAIKLTEENFIATSGENEAKTVWRTDWGEYDGSGF